MIISKRLYELQWATVPILISDSKLSKCLFFVQEIILNLKISSPFRINTYCYLNLGRDKGVSQRRTQWVILGECPLSQLRFPHKDYWFPMLSLFYFVFESDCLVTAGDMGISNCRLFTPRPKTYQVHSQRHLRSLCILHSCLMIYTYALLLHCLRFARRIIFFLFPLVPFCIESLTTFC